MTLTLDSSRRLALAAVKILALGFVAYSLATATGGPWAYRLGLAFGALALMCESGLNAIQLERSRQGGYDVGFAAGCTATLRANSGVDGPVVSVLRAAKQLAQQDGIGR